MAPATAPRPTDPRLLATRARAFAGTPAGIVALVIGVGVMMRLYRFTAPILDAHMFRQTQTASAVWLWQERGFDVLDYRVPMFGAGHWVLEFPVYQSAIWLLTLPGLGIEPAGRLVSIASFAAAAALLYLITTRLTASRLAAVAAVVVFTFLPADVFYYRTLLIDPLLIALTLLVVYAALRLHEAWSWGWFAVMAPALVLSVLGKATLMLAIGLPAVVLGVRILLSRRATLVAKGALVALALLTLLASFLWTRHADDLNRASGSLTFSNGRDWFFGTTFTDPELFRIVGQRFVDNVGPLGLTLVGIGLVASAALRTPYRLEIGAMVAGGLVSVGLFANLNRIHDYYQLPYYVTLSLLAGIGASVLHSALGQVAPPAGRQVVAGLLVALAALWSIATWSTYFAAGAVSYAVRGQALELRAATPERRLLVVQEAGDPNEPMLWYEARRTGWRVPTSEPAEADRISRSVEDLGGIVFLRGPAPEPPFIERVATARGFARTFESPAMVVYTAPR
jgi:hypothetical protein